ncbi:MAG: LysE family translocator [Marivivens sp.]|jgi:threonine/homoserine/homoserine lactone efflux protein|uniref:LysE family translocator n=1 Tax=Marivivens sp. TaxID=1978374 RepID=UPI001814B600|nr:LysE family translocator [Marivivens sp.]MCL7404619.1 LysE family translocator [Marivivens geojensis]NBQ49436.1 LysE family translocator [Marivivens sp.]NBT51891.1 LysE family translocator [Marivivens sp.]NBX08894.1 LysE family translocator [Marivivens sp.]NCW67867.1 LysE family translocator [Marivivens sp.]
MTLTFQQLALYAGALFILFMTPGPVWVALMARAMSGGFRAAWPLALGVVVGDVMWSVLAILGVSWIVSQYAGFLDLMRYVASVTFLFMGYMVIRSADKTIASDSRLTRPGIIAGFVAGLAVIIGNPKAILFYMGMLPGFFDLSQLTVADIVAIGALSAIVPLIGNLIMGAFIGKVRALLTSPRALKRMNLTAGWLLVAVGVVIPFL